MPGGAHENMRGWSPEEDELLLQLIEDKGKRWKLIAEALGDANQRTPAMVRNRFLRIERGRFLTENGMSKNRCGQCGELKRGHVCRASRPAVSPADLGTQRALHQEARFKSLTGGAGPMSPLSPATLASPGTSEGAGGVRGMGGLTLVPLQHDETMTLASPGNFHPGGTGASPGILTLGGLGTAPGPPTLRPQNSMEILAQTAMSIEHMKARMEQSEEVEAARAAAAAEKAAAADAALSTAMEVADARDAASASAAAAASSAAASPAAAPSAAATATEDESMEDIGDGDAHSSTTSHSQSEQSVATTMDVAASSGEAEDVEAELVLAEERAARLASHSSTADTLVNGFVDSEAAVLTTLLPMGRAKDSTPPPTEAQMERMQASNGEGGLEAIPNTECSNNRREAFVVAA